MSKDDYCIDAPVYVQSLKDSLIQLAKYEHSDVTVAEEALDYILFLEQQLDDCTRMQGRDRD